MTTTLSRIACYLGALILLCCVCWGKAHPLSDAQLDQVYAAGFDIRVDLDMDIAASKPESVIITGADPDAARQLLNQGMTLSHTSGRGRNDAALDSSGTYIPNLNNVVVNNINISENALQHATTLMNVFALEGDVGIALNLNVITNPVNSPINVHQTNMNWTTLNLSDSMTTLNP